MAISTSALGFAEQQGLKISMYMRILIPIVFSRCVSVYRVAFTVQLDLLAKGEWCDLSSSSASRVSRLHSNLVLTYLIECVRSHFGRPSVLNLLHYFVCSFSRCFLTNTFWSKLVHGRAIRGCFRMTVLIVHTFMDIAVQSFSSSDCTISCESASVLRSLWI